MSRPTQTPIEALDVIHAELVRTFMWYLDNTPLEQRTAAMMSVIRKFLVNNGAMFDASHKLPMRSQLAQLANLDIPFKP